MYEVFESAVDCLELLKDVFSKVAILSGVVLKVQWI